MYELIDASGPIAASSSSHYSYLSLARELADRSTLPKRGGFKIPNDHAGDLVKRFNYDIQDLKAKADTLEQAYVRVRDRVEDNQEQVTGLFETVISKMEAMEQEIHALKRNPQTYSSTPLPPSDTSLDTFQAVYANNPWGFQDSYQVPDPPREISEPRRVSVITAGDSVVIELLTGANAPVNGAPYPVMFKVAGPIVGPGGSSLDLGDARIIASALGSPAEKRAIFRLQTLSVRHPDGRRSSYPIDGWIVGEDGVRGIKGTFVDRFVEKVISSATGGFLTATGERLSEQQPTIQVQNSDQIEITTQDLNAATTSATAQSINTVVV